MTNKNRPGYKKTKIPIGWKQKDFGDFVSLSKKKYDPKNGGKNQKCIELEHIDQNTGILLGYTNSNEQLSAKNTFLEGQVLFGKLRPYLRKYWYCNFDGVCSSEIWVLVSKGCYSRYLFYLIQTEHFIRIANTTSGTKMPRSDWNFVSNYPFILPPLEEQKKIAEILSTWDKAIQIKELIIKNYELRKKALMQRLLTGKMRFKEFVKSDEYIKTKIGLVPKDWKAIKASEVFIRTSKRKNGTSTLLSVTQEHGVIPRDMLEARVTMPSGNTDSFKYVEKGNFVISLRTFQGGIEYSCYEGVVSPAYTVLTNKIDVDNNYYRYLFKSRDFIFRLSVAVIGIRDGKQISYNDFGAMKIYYPPIDEQRKIASVLTAQDKQIDLLKQQKEALEQQKKGLMQKLLTGEVRVRVS